MKIESQQNVKEKLDQRLCPSRAYYCGPFFSFIMMRPTISSWDTNRLSNLLFDLLLAIAFAIIMPREARPTISFFFTCWPGSKRSLGLKVGPHLFLHEVPFPWSLDGHFIKKEKKDTLSPRERQPPVNSHLLFYFFLFIIVSADTRKESEKRIDDCAGDSCLSFTMGTSFLFGRAFECVHQHMAFALPFKKKRICAPARRADREGLSFLFLLMASLRTQLMLAIKRKRKKGSSWWRKTYDRHQIKKRNLWRSFSLHQGTHLPAINLFLFFWLISSNAHIRKMKLILTKEK